MANVKSKQGAKTNIYKNTSKKNVSNKKKKKREEDKIVSKKAQSEKNRERANKTKTVKQTGNSRADERRQGAARARTNSANVMRSGATNYIVKDKAQTVATAPTKTVSNVLKTVNTNKDRAGAGRGRRSVVTTSVTTKRNDRTSAWQNTKKQKRAGEESKLSEDLKAKNDERKKNGYEIGGNVIAKADDVTKKINKKFNKSKQKDLEYGASVLSDEKKDIPIYTKWAKGKAKEEAKKALKEGGVTRAKAKKAVDDWAADMESQYGLTDDTVLQDGSTWAEYKAKAYKDQDDAVIKQQREYIESVTRDAGKMSAQDIYKAGVPMASEFIDYGVPYMATAKGSIKVAEKIISKAAKAGKGAKGATKAVPKIEKAVDDLVKNGQLTPEAAAKLNRKIAIRSGAKTVSTEALANAIQDATIGTTLDLGKGMAEGLEGEDLANYMKQNAIANLVMGAPMTAIAGRAGAKEAKNIMAKDFANQINQLTNLTKPEAIKLENLLKKQNNGTISTAEAQTLKEIQDKALGGGTAVVNSKGKIEVNKAENAIDDLDKAEVSEYYKLKAQDTRGTLDPRDKRRFDELQTKVQTAYKRTEKYANDAISIKGRKIKSRDQGDLENAVKFFERTGDKEKLAQAQKSLEIAKEQTRKLNDSLTKATDMMTEKTGVKYEWIDDNEMYARSGEYGNQGYTEPDGTVVINRDSPQAWQAVLGHETGHVIKKSSQEAFEKLGKDLENYVKDLGEWDGLVAEMKQRYPDYDIEGADFREELVSEMIGKYVFGEDGKFLKKLAGENPTAFERIVEYIKNLLRNSDNKELAERLTKITDDVKSEVEAIEKNASKIKEGKGEVKKSVAGKKAVGVDKAAGEEAERMFKDGASADEIWKKTGWVVDSDGKAKFEFSDKDMKLKHTMKDIKAMSEGKLSDILDHEELYKYYPKMKDVNVQFVTRRETGGAEGEFLDFGDTKYIYLVKNQTKEEMENTIIHEIQHAIQAEEDFAGGSSPEYWAEVWEDMTKQIERYKKDLPDGINDYAAIDMIRMDDGMEVAERYEKLLEKRDELRGQFKGFGFRGTPIEKLIENGSIPYSHTKGEWEARQTEKRRNMSQKELDENPREVDKHEIMVEDYSPDRRYSKKKKTDVETAKNKIDTTKKELDKIDERLSGKVNGNKRKELEAKRLELEERLDKERAEFNKLNRPVYEDRIKKAQEKIKKLEAEIRKTNDVDEIAKLNSKISRQKGVITTNQNKIDNVRKSVVSDTPVKELTDGELAKEYRTLRKTLNIGKDKSIRNRNARQERLDAIVKEAEARDVEVRTSEELVAEMVKEKRYGYEKAKTLQKEVAELDKQISELSAKLKKGGKDAKDTSKKLSKLESERTAKSTELTKLIRESKSVIPEGASAIDEFNKKVGGNTLKPKRDVKYNRAKVGEFIEEEGGLKGALKSLAESGRRKYESSLIDFELAGKELIKRGDKELGQAILDQANNVIVSKNKASATIESHRASADGTKLGKSLNDVFTIKDKSGKTIDLLEEANTEIRRDLSNYLFAKHSFARNEQGKKVFGKIGEDGKPVWTDASTKEYMDAIVSKYDELYGEGTVANFEREVREFIDYLNEYRLDTGLINKEFLDKLNDIYPYYIPTNRTYVDKAPDIFEMPKTLAEVENGIRKAVGSDAPLEDLYTQLAKMSISTIRSGEQNKLVSMYAKAKGLDPAEVPKGVTPEDVVDTAISAYETDGKWHIQFYKDGEVMRIPVNKQAAKGLREFNGQDYATFMEVSAKAGRLLHMREYKGFITDWNLLFGMRNGMRDAQQALVNSKDSLWFTRSAPRAQAAVLHENNAFRMLYDANGGRYSTLQQINRLDEIGALNKDKSTLTKGLQKIEDINGVIEMMPRMCEFIGTLQKEADNILGKGGLNKLLKDIEKEAKSIEPDMRAQWIEDEYAKRIVDIITEKKPNIISTAIRNSSDITVNFSRTGVITRALNAGFVPYLNPSVQGLSKMARMFSEGKASGTLLNFMGKLTLLTVTPSVMNEILCQNNEAYQSLNSRDKDNNFFIPMSLFGGDKDKFIKIPKPRENAVLAEPFAYATRYILDNAQYGTMDEFAQMFLSANENIGVVSVWNDNIFSPIGHMLVNKTWYGGDILSREELKNVDNGEAWKNYDETTSLFAKKMGKLANISPKKVDHIMDSYLGLIYDYGISQTSKKNLSEVWSSPKQALKNNFVVQQFTKDAVFSNKFGTQFWSKADDLNKNAKGGEDTIEYREYMAKYGEASFVYDSAINNIDNEDKLSAKEKVAMKRQLRKYKNQLYQRALKDEDVKYDPMQRIINLYKEYGIKNATDKCMSTYAQGDHAEAYTHLKQSKEYRDASPEEKRKMQNAFLKTYKGINRISRESGDRSDFISFNTVTYVCAKNNYDGGVIANCYNWKQKKYSVEDNLERAHEYIDAGYTDKNFAATAKALNRGAYELNDPDKKWASQLEDYDKAMIFANKGYRDGAYFITSKYLGSRMNAARCLADGHSGENFKWTDKRINKFCKEYNLVADKEYNWDLDQVEKAIRDKYPNKTPEEQAALFVVITGEKENPFGEIGDYSHDNDSGLFGDDEDKKKGGRGRGGRGRRGGGGGGSGGGAKFTPVVSKATKVTNPNNVDYTFTKAKVTNPFGTSNGSKSSNLNDAYRKRARKLREANYKKYKK